MSFPYYLTVVVDDLSAFRTWLGANEDAYPDIIIPLSAGFFGGPSDEFKLQADKMNPYYDGNKSISIVYVRDQNQRDFLDECPHMTLSGQSETPYPMDKTLITPPE